MNYDSLPTNVYYDVNIINNDQTGTKAPPRLVFQDIRTQPIVSYPELYELSVVRFNLATANSLPLWIPSIQLNQTSYNPNLTTYSFTLVYQYGDVRFSSGQVFVQYIPCNLAEPVPNRPAQTAAEIHVPYYFVHSFNTIDAKKLEKLLLESTAQTGGFKDSQTTKSQGKTLVNIASFLARMC